MRGDIWCWRARVLDVFGPEGDEGGPLQEIVILDDLLKSSQTRK